MFRVLNAARTSNGYGPNPIALSEILATAPVYGLYDPTEAITFIQGLDQVFLDETAKKAERERQRRQSRR